MAKAALDIQTQYFCPDSTVEQTLQRAGYRSPEGIPAVCGCFTPKSPEGRALMWLCGTRGTEELWGRRTGQTDWPCCWGIGVPYNCMQTPEGFIHTVHASTLCTYIHIYIKGMYTHIYVYKKNVYLCIFMSVEIAMQLHGQAVPVQSQTLKGSVRNRT